MAIFVSPADPRSVICNARKILNGEMITFLPGERPAIWRSRRNPKAR
jgi:hypothetical protein